MTTTISELYIAFESNLAKAQEDAASLLKIGDAAEVVDTRLTRVGRTGASVARQFDETTRASSKLGSEIRQRSANIEALQKALAAGEITQEQYAGSLAGIAKSAAAQKEKFDAATGASKLHTAALAEGTAVAKLSSYQIGILAGEAHKFADQVLAGGGAMKAAFYQVPNMITVMGGLGKATQIVGACWRGRSVSRLWLWQRGPLSARWACMPRNRNRAWPSSRRSYARPAMMLRVWRAPSLRQG